MELLEARMRLSLGLLLAQLLVVPTASYAGCPLLHASDALPPLGTQPSPAQSLNENFPVNAPDPNAPWLQVDFRADPQRYAQTIREMAKASIRLQSGKIQIDNRMWWTVPFMNYTNNGREHFNGLTRERSPNAGDLSPNSPRTAQVWAVGWYNAAGAFQFGRIWRDPCQPEEALATSLPDGTLTVKMLFTTASPSVVPTLVDAPEIQAAIDPTPQGGEPSARIAGMVRLLQVDFAVKDPRSAQTGWVFGTFAWIAPRSGDGVWDSLQLVGLHWGNDPGKTSNLQEGWINTALQGTLYGWPARPFMGFLGRVNGPADNLSSACLSCHARAQLPRARGGLAANLPDLQDSDAVRVHLDKYFQNVRAGTLADQLPNAVPLDYSLQVMNSFERHCAACAAGDVSGNAPRVCRLVRGTQSLVRCAGGIMDAFRNLTDAPDLRSLMEGLPDRQ
jgi:hypothetical protein